MTVPLAPIGFALPDGGAETIVWLVVGTVITALYLVIRSTRVKSRDHYLDRAQREEEQRRNDPDIK